MYNLLCANLHRLYRNKAFWVSIGFMILFESFFCMILLSQGSNRNDLIMYMLLQVIGVLSSVFLSLFFGTEYNDGTIRNKITVGHKRSTIYMASFMTGVVAITMIYVLWFLMGSVFGIDTIVNLHDQASILSASFFIGWLACVSYVAIFNLIGMLSTNKSKTAIISILTAFILMFAGLLCYSLSREGLFIDYKQVLFQFLFDVNPFGQTFQIFTFEITTLSLLALYAILLSIVLTCIGLFTFQKKDLK